MELVHAERLSAPRALISLHDVSPLTLPECRRAMQMFGELGLASSDLTCFVIPFHESRRAMVERWKEVPFSRIWNSFTQNA